MTTKQLAPAGVALALLAAVPAAAQVEPLGLPEACVSGPNQSPILLTAPFTPDTEPLTVDGRVVTGAKAVNTGLSVQVNVPRPGPQLRLGSRDYALDQFHFHHPVEHRMADGAGARVVEIHMVYVATSGHGEAVLTTFVQVGGAGATPWSPLLNHLPTPGDTVNLQPLNLGAMFALNDLQGERIFRYDGSLTTPAFCEGVTFLVRARPITWSATQLNSLTSKTPQLRRLLMPRHQRPIFRRN